MFLVILSRFLWFSEKRLNYNQFLGKVWLEDTFSWCLGSLAFPWQHHQGLGVCYLHSVALLFSRLDLFPGSQFTPVRWKHLYLNRLRHQVSSFHSKALSRIIMPWQHDQCVLWGKKYNPTLIFCFHIFFSNKCFSQRLLALKYMAEGLWGADFCSIGDKHAHRSWKYCTVVLLRESSSTEHLCALPIF